MVLKVLPMVLKAPPRLPGPKSTHPFRRWMVQMTAHRCGMTVVGREDTLGDVPDCSGLRKRVVVMIGRRKQSTMRRRRRRRRTRRKSKVKMKMKSMTMKKMKLKKMRKWRKKMMKMMMMMMRRKMKKMLIRSERMKMAARTEKPSPKKTRKMSMRRAGTMVVAMDLETTWKKTPQSRF